MKKKQLEVLVAAIIYTKPGVEIEEACETAEALCALMKCEDRFTTPE